MFNFDRVLIDSLSGYSVVTVGTVTIISTECMYLLSLHSVLWTVEIQ